MSEQQINQTINSEDTVSSNHVNFMLKTLIKSNSQIFYTQDETLNKCSQRGKRHVDHMQ